MHFPGSRIQVAINGANLVQSKNVLIMFLWTTFQYGPRLRRAQHRAPERIRKGQRLLYNAALDERIGAWRKARASITRIDQNKSLTRIRADDPQGYGALPVTLSRWPLKKDDEAFQAFFRRIKTRNGKAPIAARPACTGSAPR